MKDNSMKQLHNLEIKVFTKYLYSRFRDTSK